MAAKKKSLPLLEPHLVRALGLEIQYDALPRLTDWLNAHGTLNEHEEYLLQQVYNKLLRNMNHWNEEELKMEFISMITLLAYFDDPIKTYYDREISAEVGDGHFLLCKADMMLSKGIGELIETPYFFLHEYKREKKYAGDPIGQMLGGMLIGQAKNNNSKSMYGCYVQGRFWFFAVLEGKNYSISKAFDASDPLEVRQIVHILRKLKQLILEQLKD